MRFLIAGSSGFLGTRLHEHLTSAGHDVTRLVRGTPRAADERHWAPYDAPLGVDVVEGVDVVVNLAGSPTFGNPYSKKWATELEHSRVTTTAVLARAVAQAVERTDHKPALLAGNGISYYGDRGDELLDESDSSSGDDLLARVARVWQEAAQPAVDAGARVVILRTSPVLDRRSPPLSLLTPLFKAGLGGPLGNGRQYFPTISTDDWVGAVTFAAVHDNVTGPVNLTLLEPATNAEFTEALGAAVHRPTFMKVPAFAIRPAAGALAPQLLGSIRAVPKALVAAGYEFRHRDIGAAIEAALTAGR